MVKSSDIVNYTNSLIGQSIDVDGAYGAQCMDLTVHIMKKFFGWHPSGNAINLTSQSIPNGFGRKRVYNSTEIKKGDVLIWGLGAFSSYGHTAIAVEDGRSNGTFISVDQNWINANLVSGSPAAKITHDMNGVWGIIRPNYESQTNESSGIGSDSNIFIYWKKNKSTNGFDAFFVFGKSRMHIPNQTVLKECRDLISRYNGSKNEQQYNYDNFGVRVIEKNTKIVTF